MDSSLVNSQINHTVHTIKNGPFWASYTSYIDLTCNLRGTIKNADNAS